MVETVVENQVGYKKTKLGWIPEDWEVKSLREIIKSHKSGANIKKDEFLNDTTESKKFIKILPKSGLQYGGKVIIEKNKEQYIDENTKLKYKNSRIFKGELATVLRDLVPSGPNIGLIGMVSEELLMAQGVYSVNLYDFFDPNLLCQISNFEYYRKSMRKRLVGSTQVHLGLPELFRVKIIVPPLPEQKAIATCLNTWDKAIQNLTTLIANKELQKKGLMQQLLTGKKRLQGYDGEWEELNLSNIAVRVNRKNKELDDTVVTISAKRGFVLQEDFFNKRVASNTLSNYTLVHNGEYCYNKSYSNGYPMGAFKRLDDFKKAVVTTLYICFKLKDNVDSNFMKQYFEAGQMIPGLMRIAQEGGRAHGLLNIGLKDFFGLELSIPSKQEQTAVASVLQKADQEIAILNKKLDQLKMQKKGLMQQLLTGKKRLKY